MEGVQFCFAPVLRLVRSPLILERLLLLLLRCQLLLSLCCFQCSLADS